MRKTVSLYNVIGELVERIEGANAPMSTRATDKASVSITYNGAGQLKTHTAAGAVTTFAYDSSGFRTSVASPNFGAVTSRYTKFGELYSRTDGKGTTTWKYDVLGRSTKREDPDGAAEWSYDPTGSAGALGWRCYHKSATATACPGATADRDFNEVLEYVSRGGGWDISEYFLRSAYRNWGRRNPDQGFRVALTLPE